MRDRLNQFPAMAPAVLWAALAFAFSSMPSLTLGSAPSGSQVIWTFDRISTNSLGGKYNTFSKEPSWSRIYLDPVVRRAPAGHSLRVTAHRDAQGKLSVTTNDHL